jgi:hypothetical protein
LFKENPMKRGNWILKELKETHPIVLGFLFLTSLSISILGYLNHLVYPLHGAVNFVIALLIAIPLTAILLIIYTHLVRPIISKLNKNQRLKIILISLALTLALTFTISLTNRNLFFLYPEESITITIAKTENTGSGLSIARINNGIKDISFADLKSTGNFEIQPEGIFIPGGQDASISWSGIVKQKASIVINPTINSQSINVTWDREASKTIVIEGGEGVKTISHKFPPLADDGLILRIILFPILFAILFLLAAGFYGPIPYSSALILFWGFILFIYWPGIIGNVNLTDINNLFIGNIDNWHPVVYSIIAGIITKLFFSATGFLLFQIAAYGLVIGWGFSFLESEGANKKILWALTILIAILPSNLLSVISFTNDMLYSVALLALTILVIKIIFSNGIWLEKTRNIVIFAIAALISMTTRYNGIPAVGFALLCMLLFLPTQRINLLKASGLIVLSFFLINGPLFSILGVKRVTEGQLDNILLHHIGAHISAGTALSPEEFDYLNSLYPLEEWKNSYTCCTNLTVVNNPEFNDKVYQQNSALDRRIAFDLFVKSPLVDFSHTLCASDLVWNVPGSCPISRPNIERTNGIYYWTRSNSPEYTEQSLLPGLVIPLSKVINTVDADTLLYTLVWRPALYLYLAILSVVIFCFRNKSWKSLMILSPLMGQTLFLFAVNRVPNFRYQYCAVLIGAFLLSMIFLKRNKE